MKRIHAAGLFLLLAAFFLGFSAGRTTPTSQHPLPAGAAAKEGQSATATISPTTATRIITTPTPTGLSLATRGLWTPQP